MIEEAKEELTETTTETPVATTENTKPVTKKPPVPAFIKYHKDLCIELHNVYVAKNADYGSSFHQTYRSLGPISALTRMTDKWNRIVNLAKGGKPAVNEAIRDTLMDLAGYCLLWIMELDAENKKHE